MVSSLLPFFFLLIALISSHSAQEIAGNFLITLRASCNDQCERDVLSELQRTSGTSGCVIARKISARRTTILNVVCPEAARVSSDTLSSAFTTASSSRRSVPGVADVENNVIFTTQGFLSTVQTSVRQSESTRWNIDEVDGGSPRDGIRTCPASTRGQGAHIWILDTGCEPMNGGVCKGVFESSSGAPPCRDVDGHGTHVAGSATHPEFGVAPNARRSCYKVLDDEGFGTADGIIEAILDVATMRGQTSKGDIINMSLGGPRSRTLDTVIQAMAAEGIYFSVAAGNDGSNSCGFSPARASLGARNVYSVQAHDKKGRMPGFSNFARKGEGRNQCTDLSGPGVKVRSEKLGGGSIRFDGTSMASPHVGGAIATLLGNNKEVNLENLIEGGFFVTIRRRKNKTAERKAVGLPC